MFDAYLPVVVLGPAMAYFQPPTLSPALQSTLFYVVFALSLVGRPVGAAVFGHYSDKLGRRKVTLISMAGFAVVTFLIGLLPGYSMALMSLITLALLRLAPGGSPHSAYVTWGWRVPFFLGGLFGCGVFLYCLLRVPESKVWAKAERAKSPLGELWRGDNPRILGQVFLVMSGAWFTLNAVTSILPGVLLTVRHVDSVTVTNAQLIENLVMVFLLVPFGMLGQMIGRRTVLWMIGLAGCTVGPIFYYVLVRSGYRNTVELIVLVTLINLCAMPVWAIITAYINERFSTGVRASGYGLGYSLATIIPAFSSFYMLALKRLGMQYPYTEVAIFALGGLLLMIGALSGPETNHIDIS